MTNPVVFDKLHQVEKVIDKIIEDTKKGEISWERCENSPDFKLVSKNPIAERNVFLESSEQMMVGGKDGNIPFIYKGKGVRKLYRVASYDVMPEDVKEWIKMIIDSN